MNKQLAHITFRRLQPQQWDGSANEPLLREFQAAWKAFLLALDEPYRSEFERRLSEKQESPGFEHLNLC